MIQIAICDDDAGELTIISDYMKEYIETNKLEAQVKQFSHPDALLTACEKERFSLYILDIVMPMIDGITVGKEIRKIDREAQIIYATSEASFALNAYVANPVNYLLKPVDKTKLFDTLTLAISRLNLDNEVTLVIKTKEGLRVVPLFAIVCCEYVKRTVQYTLSDGEIVLTRTLQESFSDYIATLLSDRRFLQPHSSYVINMNRVERFSKDGFAMRGGAIVPISKKQYTSIRDKYMNYLFSK